jgi:hypothetical protein
MGCPEAPPESLNFCGIGHGQMDRSGLSYNCVSQSVFRTQGLISQHQQ